MRNDSDNIFDGKPDCKNNCQNNTAHLRHIEEARHQLELNLSSLEDRIGRIKLVCTLCDHAGPATATHTEPFGAVTLLYLTAYSPPLTITFDATNPQSSARSILLAELYRYRSHWRLRAVGQDLSDASTPENSWISQARGLGLIA